MSFIKELREYVKDHRKVVVPVVLVMALFCGVVLFRYGPDIAVVLPDVYRKF